MIIPVCRIGASANKQFAGVRRKVLGILLETVAAAEARVPGNQYTIQNVTRVMTQATEMMRTMQPEDKGAALGEMIRTIILLP